MMTKHVPKSVTPKWQRTVSRNWPNVLMSGIVLAVLTGGIVSINEQLKELRQTVSTKVDKADCRYEMQREFNSHSKGLPNP